MPTEHRALLIHSHSGTATKLAVYASRKNDVEADIKTFSTVKEDRFTSKQRTTLSVLPFQLRRVNAACQEAVNGLAVFVPTSPVDALGLSGNSLRPKARLQSEKKRGGWRAYVENAKRQQKKSSGKLSSR